MRAVAPPAAPGVIQPPPDTRSPIAIAYAWAWRVITISFEMVIPGVLGLGMDLWLEIQPFMVFTLLGFGLGMTVGILHLLKIANALNQSDTTTETPSHPDEDR